jgi:hypothetical protein
VMAEVQALLDWLLVHAPGLRAPQEEGGAWDAHLQQQEEAGGWTTVTLTLVGPLAWGDAMLAHFAADDAD